MRGALGPNGQLFQAFVLGGKTRTLEVGSTWTEFVPGTETADLFAFDIPAGTRQVYSTSTTDIPELVDGAQLLPAHRPFMFPHRAGGDILGFDRDGRSGLPRFFFICDPDDATDGAAASARIVFRQGA
jgi:hypothetical protein